MTFLWIDILILFCCLECSLLKNTGQYQETISGRNGGIAKPDDLAAIQVMPNSPDWILAKVITHDPNSQMYKLADEDIESNKSKYLLASIIFKILPPLTFIHFLLSQSLSLKN